MASFCRIASRTIFRRKSRDTTSVELVLASVGPREASASSRRPTGEFRRYGGGLLLVGPSGLGGALCRTICFGMIFDAVTITSDSFPELLAQTEGPGIDFKRDPYDLGHEEGRAALIKDILSTANTPRTGPAYIVLGVKAHPDGTKELVGLSENVDDSEYQSSVKSKVHPSPTFLYVPVQFRELTFGVLVIPAERRGPFQAVMDVGKKLRRYVIYWRRGSQNDEARPDEQELIRRWCSGDAKKPIEISSSPQTPWESFLVASHLFEPDRILYPTRWPGFRKRRASAVGAC
jgi:hypothetical protein